MHLLFIYLLFPSRVDNNDYLKHLLFFRPIITNLSRASYSYIKINESRFLFIYLVFPSRVHDNNYLRIVQRFQPITTSLSRTSWS